jgi:hypothetical protein
VTSVRHELIVVDNGSCDGSVHMLKRRFPLLTVIESQKNLGFGKAVNLAVRRSSGEFLWLLNSDCLLNRDIVPVMLDYFGANADVAAVTGRLVSADGSFQASCRRFPNFSNVFLSRQSPLSRLFPSMTSYTLPDYSVPTPVDACACTNTMIRRSAFEAVGGFDERFFMYCEDTDICRRFGDHRWKVVYIPHAEVGHLWARSWLGSQWLRHFYHYQSMSRYFRKHFESDVFGLAILDTILVIGLGLKLVFSVARAK